MEAKAVKFLRYVDPPGVSSADEFLSSLASSTAESLNDFVQCIVVLLSTPSQAITTATMEMLNHLLLDCSPENRLALVKANLIPQLAITLNPQPLSFMEAEDIHISLIRIIAYPLQLTTTRGFEELGIKKRNKQQAVRKTVFQQVLVPSEKYIWHLCVNRFSIIDGDMSIEFMFLLALILQICPYHQPTMAVILHMPVFPTIPSCLTFFENDASIYYYLFEMIISQRKWNKKRGSVRLLGKKVIRMLKMESFEDVMEEKLQNDRKTDFGRWIVDYSIRWNNLLSMNLPKQE
ncbi:hypothetical protein BLNAU_8077 [Blattamonas nauphoetae]|uniref:Uncharacterized protein n=1 Tax=Blattamonas nauphoetae TaxID=2049346 RepID=A0ABQ9XZR6_9EUKA|nr:hypothetical protein BLNAU_8077 [Blattamonas nauphoetae]